MPLEDRTARLTVLIDPRKKALLERICAEQDTTPSQVVRQLINNAAAGIHQPAATMALKHRRIMFEVNFHAPFSFINENAVHFIYAPPLSSATALSPSIFSLRTSTGFSGMVS